MQAQLTLSVQRLMCSEVVCDALFQVGVRLDHMAGGHLGQLHGRRAGTEPPVAGRTSTQAWMSRMMACRGAQRARAGVGTAAAWAAQASMPAAPCTSIPC